MRRIVLAALVMGVVLLLGGCGGSDPPLFTTHIISDPSLDGDIARNPSTGVFTITQGMSLSPPPAVQSVLAGLDPNNGIEYRAFLTFPLTGTAGVPGDAVIQSAFLDIFIDSIAPLRQIPIVIELVEFQPPTLVGTDFERSSLPTIRATKIVPPLGPADVGQHVVIDVTPLMIEAQRLQLADFQVRIAQDFDGGLPGIIEINDTTEPGGRGTSAPLLEVNYF